MPAPSGLGEHKFLSAGICDQPSIVDRVDLHSGSEPSGQLVVLQLPGAIVKVWLKPEFRLSVRMQNQDLLHVSYAVAAVHMIFNRFSVDCRQHVTAGELPIGRGTGGFRL